jgi:hypothetical protein
MVGGLRDHRVQKSFGNLSDFVQDLRDAFRLSIKPWQNSSPGHLAKAKEMENEKMVSIDLTGRFFDSADER